MKRLQSLLKNEILMEKELVKEKIQMAFENFKTAILHHSDINKKRADGGWSVGEIANHILKGTSANLGATKKTERPYDQHAEGIRNLFLNFKMKFPAAPVLRPDSRLYSIEDTISLLDNSKEGILKMIESKDLTETCIDIAVPVWGKLTKFEWLVLFENHLIRHTKQVNEFNTVVALTNNH
jgi:hypothetical protein